MGDPIEGDSNNARKAHIREAYQEILDITSMHNLNKYPKLMSS